MECFRIDESGYTGFDLLNLEQRVQGASAIAIDNDTAARLIKEHFPTLKAAELKYQALSRRPVNHPRLLALLRDLHQSYKCVTYVCDKRYMLLLMFADYAVEPFYYERGVNFYENGQNFAMASMLYRIGPTLLGGAEFDRLQVAFQRAMKDKSPESLMACVAAAQATRWKEFPEAMGPMASGNAACLDAIETPGIGTDVAIIVLTSLLSRLEVMSDGPYRVEHDQSKNLTRYHDLLRGYIEHDEKAEFRATEITTLKFPLKVESVTQVDSKANPAVQLADVMIGAAIDATNGLMGHYKGGLDPQAVISTYRDEQIIHMLPSIDFAEQRRFRHRSQANDIIDYFGKHFGHRFPGAKVQ